MDTLKNLKVLYVEDDDNTRASLGRFLKRRFGKVYTAENGEEGIEIFNEQNPDIAIVDILLPGISGLEMIKTIREAGSKCKFLITSTVNDVSTILEAVDLNIENYIIKPINTDELEEKLKRAGNAIMNERQENVAAADFTLESKKEAEENIRKGILKLLKEKSGRGPRDAVVFISGNTIEITAYGILGPFEKTLITNFKNAGHIEESRRLFYMCIEDELATMIKEMSGIQVTLKSIKVDALKDREFSTFLTNRAEIPG